jgi:hypothetical protein
MQPNRRQHRTPFTATAYGRINDADGTQIALCMTPRLARFICVCCNSFDMLTMALDLCRGEIHLDEIIRKSPAIQKILEIRDYVETQLRGTNN